MGFTPFSFLTLGNTYLDLRDFYCIFVPYLYHVLLVDKVTLKRINRLIEYRLCQQPNFKSLGNARYVVQSSWLRLLNHCIALPSVRKQLGRENTMKSLDWKKWMKQ